MDRVIRLQAKFWEPSKIIEKKLIHIELKGRGSNYNDHDMVTLWLKNDVLLIALIALCL